MKVCTITCHNVYNHGASLQAYALMKYLLKCGHEVEIIDYRPDYLSNHYKIFKISNPKWTKNVLTQMIYYVIKVPGKIISLKRKKAFDKFTNDFLQITKNRYLSNQELKHNTPNADAYICGSDQIWNSLHRNGRDLAFYLDFAPDEKIKLSYAASFATDKIADEFKPMVKEKVENLDGVGVREKSGVEILKDLNIKKAVTVVDPVFLLDKNDWNEIGTIEFSEKYILVYDFDKSAIIEKIARDIAILTGYKIYSINTYKTIYADKCFNYDGPETFVSLVRKAEYIISNSFHAIVFSVIYDKNIIAVNRKEALNIRMIDLLDDLKLSSRLVDDNYNIEELLVNIDYGEPKKNLNDKINFSKKYLKELLATNKQHPTNLLVK